MTLNKDHNQKNNVTTIGVRELKARASEIIREVELGREFVVTRHGHTCGRLTPFKAPDRAKGPVISLRGAYPDLPELSDEEFQEVKLLWRVKG